LESHKITSHRGHVFIPAGGEPSLSSGWIYSVYEVMADYFVSFVCQSAIITVPPGFLLEGFSGQNLRDDLRIFTLIPLLLLLVHSAYRAHGT